MDLLFDAFRSKFSFSIKLYALVDNRYELIKNVEIDNRSIFLAESKSNQKEYIDAFILNNIWFEPFNAGYACMKRKYFELEIKSTIQLREHVEKFRFNGCTTSIEASPTFWHRINKGEAGNSVYNLKMKNNRWVKLRPIIQEMLNYCGESCNFKKKKE